MDSTIIENGKISFTKEELEKRVEEYEERMLKNGAEKAELHDKACEYVIKEVYAQLGISEEYIKEQYELINNLKNKNKIAQDDSFNEDYEKQKQIALNAADNTKSSKMDAVETGLELAVETGKIVVLALGGIEIVAPAVLGASTYATIAAGIASITAAPVFGPAVLAGAVGALIYKFNKKAKTAKANETTEGVNIKKLERKLQQLVENLDKIREYMENNSDYIIEQYSLYQDGTLSQEEFDSIVKSYTSEVLSNLGVKTNSKVNTKVKNKINPAGSKDKVASNPSAKSARSSKTPVEKSLNSPILMQQDESKNSINTEIITEQTIEEKEEML